MAHKKSGGSTKNGRDSNPQFRGVKLYGGEAANAGSIVVRQCGTHFKPGFMMGRGRDDTLYAQCAGEVVFRGRQIHINPADASAERPFFLAAAAG